MKIGTRVRAKAAALFHDYYLDSYHRAAGRQKTKTKQQYVCGFAFYDDRVVLIRKEKPDWQKGKLNGVGGKIESGESPEQAMAREFREETGVSMPVWSVFAHMSFPDSEVFFLRTFNSYARNARTTEFEEIEHRDVRGIDEMPEGSIVPNLRWLIPMAYHSEPKRAIVHVHYS